MEKLLATFRKKFLQKTADKRLSFLPYFKYFNSIPDEQKYELFFNAWCRLEYGFHYITEEFIKELMLYPRPPINIPGYEGQNELVVYRGMGSESNHVKQALSWTTEIDKAMWFAKRWCSYGAAKVYQAKIDISNIVGYIDDREESEVIVLPSCLMDVTKIARVTKDGEVKHLNSRKAG